MSWGPDICGQAGVPGVLADVSKALPWLRKVLAGKVTGRTAGEAADRMDSQKVANNVAPGKAGDNMDTKKAMVWNSQGWKMQ